MLRIGKINTKLCENPNPNKQVIKKYPKDLTLLLSITLSAMYIANKANNASVVYCFNSLEKNIKMLLNEHRKSAIAAVCSSKNDFVNL
tara:strand:+ start:226 stop:489 length:264 start_codon:yes stop_codon:yes gene_type:complete